VDPVIALLGEEWEGLDRLGTTLSDEEWSRPTDCPEWTVHDQFAHMVGTETSLADGRRLPEGLAPSDPWPGHVHNPIGAMNEVLVEARRRISHAELLDEFRQITSRRLAQLMAMSDESLSAVGPSPIGPVPYRESMDVRLMDCWVHEQDIRRAVGRPGHREGPIVERSLDRFTSAMPFVVGKKAGAPSGCTVVFDLTGPAARTIAVEVDGRARLTASVPETPTVRLVMDTETWWCLDLGRWSPASVLADGLVRIDGDMALGTRVVMELAFMI